MNKKILFYYKLRKKTTYFKMPTRFLKNPKKL